MTAATAPAMAASVHATADTIQEADEGELIATNADNTMTLELIEEDDESVTVGIASLAEDTAGFYANLSYDGSDVVITDNDIEFEDLDGIGNVGMPEEGHVAMTESVTGDNSLDKPKLAMVTFTVEDGLQELEFVDDSHVTGSDAERIEGEDDIDITEMSEGDDGESAGENGTDTSADNEEGSTDDGNGEENGLPGFTALAALGALVIVLIALGSITRQE
ncbi:hypothetical protein [Natrialba sp. SSL1]|uniref:hypothetical protein n=1 Tax=Natrialba sp. SSL1 TaxID=1869245 RepID=UPI00209B6DF6|nr:hypothetical protein [Natrialba sp. SSL1]